MVAISCVELPSQWCNHIGGVGAFACMLGHRLAHQLLPSRVSSYAKSGSGVVWPSQTGHATHIDASVVVGVYPRSHEAFRNYNFIGAGFNWATQDWDSYHLWKNMPKEKAVLLVREMGCRVAYSLRSFVAS